MERYPDHLALVHESIAVTKAQIDRIETSLEEQRREAEAARRIIAPGTRQFPALVTQTAWANARGGIRPARASPTWPKPALATPSAFDE